MFRVREGNTKSTSPGFSLLNTETWGIMGQIKSIWLRFIYTWFIRMASRALPRRAISCPKSPLIFLGALGFKEKGFGKSEYDSRKLDFNLKRCNSKSPSSSGRSAWLSSPYHPNIPVAGPVPEEGHFLLRKKQHLDCALRKTWKLEGNHINSGLRKK